MGKLEQMCHFIHLFCSHKLKTLNLGLEIDNMTIIQILNIC